MAARKHAARGHIGDIPTENKPKTRTPARKTQASAPTPRAASTSKSAALNIPMGNKSAKSTPQKARRVYSDQELIDAIYRHNGLIVRVADALDCDRNTIYNRAAASPAVQEALDKARLYAVDTAEDALHKRITDGDTTAIIFLLKTLGKQRGYVERMEMTGKDGESLFTLSDLLRGDGE